MSLLTDREKARAVADVRATILAAGRPATLSRPEPGERLFARDDETFATVGPLVVELAHTPSVDLSGRIDAVASVAPETDAREQDRLEIDGEAYRVQTVVEERLFGAATHKTLRLVRIHGNATDG